MEEADTLCNRVAILDRGQIAVEGQPSELKRRVEGNRITVELDALPARAVQDPKDIAGSVEGVVRVMENGSRLTVYSANGSRTVPEIVAAYNRRGIHVVSVTLTSPSLDDVFLQVTGKTIRPEAPVAPKRGHRRRFH